MKLITTFTMRDVPHFPDKRFRYPRLQLPPGWTRYTFPLPPEK
jgi:hypothetical protein